MLKIQIENDVVEIPIGICQISETINQLNEKSDGNVINLPEVDRDTFDVVKDFYMTYDLLDDATKALFNNSVTVPDCPLKDQYITTPVEILVVLLDIASYLQMEPFTNLLCSVFATHICDGHQF